MTEDKRIVHSRERICEGFLRCIMKTSLDKMTVSAICKEADVNRSTFYAHYRDPQDLYEAIMKSFFEEVEQNLLRFQNGEISHRSYVLTVMQYAKDHREKVQGLIAADRERFRDTLVSILSRHDIYSSLHKMIKNKYQQTFYLDGSTGVATLWLSDGCRETPEEMTEILLSLTYSEEQEI